MGLSSLANLSAYILPKTCTREGYMSKRNLSVTHEIVFSKTFPKCNSENPVAYVLAKTVQRANTVSK